MRGMISTVMGAAIVLGATAAGAQDLTTPQVTTTTATVTTSTGGSVTDTSGATDHSVVVGHLGLRYFGSTSATALSGSMTPQSNGSLTLHTVGARVWVNPSLALEAGLSLGIRTSGSSTTTTTGTTTTTTSSDDPNAFGFGLRFGLPIAVAESKHVTISVVPSLGFVFASSGIQTQSSMASGGVGGRDLADFSASYFRLDLGAAAQAELQFGFLGVPQLGLIAQFGLNLHFASSNFSVNNIPSMTQQQSSLSTSRSDFGLETSVGPNYSLGDIVSGSVSAVWYFGGGVGR